MEAVLEKPKSKAQPYAPRMSAIAQNGQVREVPTPERIDYFRRRLNAATDKWWKENNMTQEKFLEMTNVHFRLPYK